MLVPVLRFRKRKPEENVDEKTLEEIQFHTETIESDENSPLHLIREKEMELSGQALAVKKQAEELVASARRRAVDTVREAEAEGERLAADREKVVLAEVEQEVAKVARDTEEDIAGLETVISERMDTAVEYVVGVVVPSSRR